MNALRQAIRLESPRPSYLRLLGPLNPPDYPTAISLFLAADNGDYTPKIARAREFSSLPNAALTAVSLFHSSGISHIAIPGESILPLLSTERILGRALDETSLVTFCRFRRLPFILPGDRAWNDAERKFKAS